MLPQWDQFLKYIRLSTEAFQQSITAISSCTVFNSDDIRMWNASVDLIHAASFKLDRRHNRMISPPHMFLQHGFWGVGFSRLKPDTACPDNYYNIWPRRIRHRQSAHRNYALWDTRGLSDRTRFAKSTCAPQWGLVGDWAIIQIYGLVPEDIRVRSGNTPLHNNNNKNETIPLSI